MDTSFKELALLCEELGLTKSRLKLASLIADFLRKVAPEEIRPAVYLILGRVFPDWDSRSLDISWKAMWKITRSIANPEEQDYEKIFSNSVDAGDTIMRIFEKKFEESCGKSKGAGLSILDVYKYFEGIASTKGKGSRERKEYLIHELFIKADPLESKYIAKNVIGEMRHGVSEGIILEAISTATNIESDKIRKANMLTGDVGEVAFIAVTQGEAGISNIPLKMFRPLKPMLAQTSNSVKDALGEFKKVRTDEPQKNIALEYKYDGARLQIHKQGNEIKVFSRRLTDITAALPDVVKLIGQSIKAQSVILEGELIGVDSSGRPLPFQHIMRRLTRVHGIGKMIKDVPVKLHLFDCLAINGNPLIDFPYKERWRELKQLKGDIPLATRIVANDPEKGEKFLHQSIKEGHEGLMAKSLMSKYTPGVRGKAWLKIKKAITLDLVIVAADWGYGRRHNWLSNYHLAAWNDSLGEFLMVGKTFKGLTDKEFESMTKSLLSLRVREYRSTVYVRPKVVVEVAFNEIQKSPRYKSGMALRFARITRIRDDKLTTEASTIKELRNIYEKQFAAKGFVK
jgi:DNA ligase-1